MCNLYSMTSNKEAIREFARYLRVAVNADNLGSHPDVFPNEYAPIVRNTLDGRELALSRWGMPKSAKALEGKNYDNGVTNVRETDSWHWRQWLDVENRCVVPVTSFCEPDQASGSKENIWFALTEDRPLFFFAGIWLPSWTSVRKVSEGESTDDLYAFLTTEANKDVGTFHPKAMPVILRTPASIDYWLSADVDDALDLQRPLANGTLQVVARGQKFDPPWAEPRHPAFAPTPKPQLDLF
ncbi:MULTISPECIES: SOS response-associated peptidase [Asticcacaulis]|uniref:SOS response-associated peptidase n=1 Tax=Asticcacaulis TaxID=76890 RepID=UPI001AE8987E|nr:MULTISPECIES: SOS response-associated peptidase [Asticcacaulis]MBP2159115.1 putative SOS response-associated peptidase YedK [Asticcacaulis solisilvae]MDR6800160.1 putative SOS response-associated peptidase YedK [Asticcacaulis sp. BE141]